MRLVNMSENIIEPVVENIAIQKIAIATKDYKDYEILKGDYIAFGTYMTQYDIQPDAWNQQISYHPVLSVIDHEWIVLESGQNLPEIKVPKIP